MSYAAYEHLEIYRLLPSILFNRKEQMLCLICNQAIVPNFAFLELNHWQIILSNSNRNEIDDLKMHCELDILNCRVKPQLKYSRENLRISGTQCSSSFNFVDKSMVDF